MKRSLPAVITTGLLFVVGLSACELQGEDTIVGSSGDTQVPSLVFTVDTTYSEASPAKLVARGRVRNNGTGNVASPWYVEGQFYTDGTMRTKLGGSSTRIGVPLSRNEEVFWTLTFSSGNVDVRLYPDFKVGNLRGIYK